METWKSKSSDNVKVIDVSHHQGSIDWAKVAADGVHGAFIKATEGLTGNDEMLSANAVGAVKEGINIGFYHYARPENNDAKKEAAYFAEKVKGYQCDFPLVLDVEGGASKLGGAALTTWCVIFLQELEWLTGRTSMIYTGASFAKSYLGKELAAWPLWIAHYGVDMPMTNNTWGTWSVFQYSDSGQVSGITGNVDINVMEKSFFDKYTKQEEKVKSVGKEVTAIVFGKQIEGAQLINGVTMLPLRAVGEAIGGKVSWDPDTLTATITK